MTYQHFASVQQIFLYICNVNQNTTATTLPHLLIFLTNTPFLGLHRTVLYRLRFFWRGGDFENEKREKVSRISIIGTEMR